MKEILITKRCSYQPPGATVKVKVRPGQKVIVDDEQFKKMVEGNTGVLYVPPKPEAKKAPVNRQKKVSKVK